MQRRRRGLYGLRVGDGTVRWQRPDIVANDGVSPMRVGDVVYMGAGAAGFRDASVPDPTIYSPR